MDDVRTGYPYELGAEDPFAMPPAVIPPCPLCSGEVPRDDPAPTALGWGVRVAQAEPGASRFWKVAKAAEIYNQSDARSEAMDLFVSRGLGALVDRGLTEDPDSTVLFSEGEQKDDHSDRSDKDPEIEPPPDDRIPWPPGTGYEGGSPIEEGEPFKSPGGKGSEWFGKGTCCPKEPFHFPVPGSVRARDGDMQGNATSGTATPSFEYSVEANFDEAAEGCLCECCVFRQEVLLNHVSSSMGEPDTLGFERVPTASETPPGVDCFWLFHVVVKRGEGKRLLTYVGRVGGQDAPPPAPTHTIYGPVESIRATLGPFCVGGDAPLPGEGKGDTRGGYGGKGDCKYTWTDTPQQSLARMGDNPAGTPSKDNPAWMFKWTWRVRGLILDRCHFYEVKREKEWTVQWLGTVSGGNDVSMEVVYDSSRSGFLK